MKYTTDVVEILEPRHMSNYDSITHEMPSLDGTHRDAFLKKIPNTLKNPERHSGWFTIDHIHSFSSDNFKKTLHPERNHTDVNVTFTTVEHADYLQKH